MKNKLEKFIEIMQEEVENTSKALVLGTYKDPSEHFKVKIKQGTKLEEINVKYVIDCVNFLIEKAKVLNYFDDEKD